MSLNHRHCGLLVPQTPPSPIFLKSKSTFRLMWRTHVEVAAFFSWSSRAHCCSSQLCSRPCNRRALPCQSSCLCPQF
uniref:Uncharacterized protein n=1 Tax=Arundo donax TaxID=35708 RepID=A0A0A9DZR7_ARUDO